VDEARTPPRWYRIRVEGELPPSWPDRLAGFAIAVERREGGGKPLTVLRVRLLDPAGLVGVLGSLYDLHTTVRSVEVIDHEANSRMPALEGSPSQSHRRSARHTAS
jgi:hypothetical protein